MNKYFGELISLYFVSTVLGVGVAQIVLSSPLFLEQTFFRVVDRCLQACNCGDLFAGDEADNLKYSTINFTTTFSRDASWYPFLTTWSQGVFQGREVGVYILKPPQQNFFTAPSLIIILSCTV